MKRVAALVFTAAAFCAAPAYAFDCKRAASDSEKAICADPAALAADADLGKAFETLRAAADPKSALGWSRPKSLGYTAARRRLLRSEGGRPQRVPDDAEPRASGVPHRRAGGWRRNAGPARAGLSDAEGRQGQDGHRHRGSQIRRSLRRPAQRAFNAAADKLSDDLEEPDEDEPDADSITLSTCRCGSPMPRRA
jgi:hypothetical protein